MPTLTLRALDATPLKGLTVYPQPFARLVAGRTKRKLGEAFRPRNFGVNLTHLDPGAISALFNSHAAQDEFVYVLEGHPTLLLGEEEHELSPGDSVTYPRDDVVARLDSAGAWVMTRKDGSAY
jgi:uncharacterized cupin superfamily protein